MTLKNVRRAELSDVPGMMAIRSSVRENVLSDPGKVTHADYVRFISAGQMWVWIEDGHLLGFSASDERNGSIWAVFVAPGQEGKGIGRALLSPACASLGRAGYRRATLSTEAGTRAERFYRRGGWMELERNDEGEIVFQRALDDLPS